MAQLTTAASEQVQGTRTFYLTSFSDPKQVYVLKRIVTRRRTVRWTCTCGDWVNVSGPLNRPCKHLKLLRTWIKLAGGLRHIPKGVTVSSEGDDGYK